jgi:hypothetical protein
MSTTLTSLVITLRPPPQRNDTPTRAILDPTILFRRCTPERRSELVYPRMTSHHVRTHSYSLISLPSNQWTTNDVLHFPRPGTAATSESLPYVITPMFQADEAPIVSSLGHPLDIIPEQLTVEGSLYTQPATEANTEPIPYLQHHPPLMDPVLGGLPRSCAESRSGALDKVTRSSYHLAMLSQDSGGIRHPSRSPAGQTDFCGRLPFSTFLGIDVPAEAMDTRRAAYTGPPRRPYFLNLQVTLRPVHQGHQCGHAARQIGDPETHNRTRSYTCPVADCGKCFSGQSEKNRHIRSKHRPPTMGCRKCNYKQSRRDLFREHCKKRHPGESADDLLVRLVQVGRAHNAVAGLRTGHNSRT